MINLIEEFREILDPIVKKEIGDVLLVGGTIYFYFSENKYSINLYTIKKFPENVLKEKKSIKIDEKNMFYIYQRLEQYINLPLFKDCDRLMICFSHQKEVSINVDWKIKLK